MSYRTFHIHGRADDSAGTVTVDGVVVHNGIIKDGILFEYVTASTLHGKVDVMVSMTYGSIIIDNVNVTYPAVIEDIEYSLYMYNGPAAWIVDGSLQRYIFREYPGGIYGWFN